MKEPKTKICQNCSKRRDIEMFQRYQSTVRGKVYKGRRPNCKPCQKELKQEKDRGLSNAAKLLASRLSEIREG